MDRINKRFHEDASNSEDNEPKDKLIKQFEGKKLFQWTDEQKREWIASPSCSSLFDQSPLFACKQVLNPMLILHVSSYL